PAGRLMKALVGFVLCMCLLTVAVGIQHPFFIVIGAPVTAFILFLFLNYRGIQVKVTDEKLLINYGFFNRKCIPIGDIVSCEPIKASLRRYGGVGIRHGTDGSRAYTTSLGDAVKITLQKRRPFVFSSNNPEKICSIINQVKMVS
ncbi:MAG: PH domain-containing protein, partial [Candidatus Bathyarchaeota archaeon]|nr:PH domain-containing protein [Candidatus Bathyarchaeota archaeon]